MDNLLDFVNDMASEDMSQDESKQEPVKSSGGEHPEEDGEKQEDVRAQEEQESSEKETKEYSSEELSRLLRTDPASIDISRVPESIRPVVEAEVERVMGQTAQEELRAFETELEQAKEVLAVQVAQVLEQKYGYFNAQDPQQLAEYNAMLADGYQRLKNAHTAKKAIVTLQNRDGKEMFDSVIERLKANVARSPLLQEAWDEANIAVLLPEYERIKAELMREKFQKSKQASSKSNPPHVLEPGSGKQEMQPSIKPDDLGGMDVDEQAEALVKLGIV